MCVFKILQDLKQSQVLPRYTRPRCQRVCPMNMFYGWLYWAYRFWSHLMSNLTFGNKNISKHFFKKKKSYPSFLCLQILSGSLSPKGDCQLLGMAFRALRRLTPAQLSSLVPRLLFNMCQILLKILFLHIYAPSVKALSPSFSSCVIPQPFAKLSLTIVSSREPDVSWGCSLPVTVGPLSQSPVMGYVWPWPLLDLGVVLIHFGTAGTCVQCPNFTTAFSSPRYIEKRLPVILLDSCCFFILTYTYIQSISK